MIAGTAKGRRLDTPKGLATRPVTDRVKESLFGMLGSAVEGAKVLDLFAGSGALAIEALSRGATSALLVERDRATAGIISSNLERCGFERHGVVRRSDALALLERSPSPGVFDLVFCDPPYDIETATVERVFAALDQGWVAPGSTVVIRRRAGEKPPTSPPTWEFTRERTFGDTLVLVASVT